MRLIVPYRGPRTISSLILGYVQTNDAIADAMCDVSVDGDREIEYEFPMFSSTILETGTDRVLATLREMGLRGFNIPETLALGLEVPEKCLYGYGQAHRGPYMFHAVYVFRRKAGLNSFYGSLGNRGPYFTIPATRAPDPLEVWPSPLLQRARRIIRPPYETGNA